MTSDNQVGTVMPGHQVQSMWNYFLRNRMVCFLKSLMDFAIGTLGIVSIIKLKILNPINKISAASKCNNYLIRGSMESNQSLGIKTIIYNGSWFLHATIMLARWAIPFIDFMSWAVAGFSKE